MIHCTLSIPWRIHDGFMGFSRYLPILNSYHKKKTNHSWRYGWYGALDLDVDHFFRIQLGSPKADPRPWLSGCLGVAFQWYTWRIHPRTCKWRPDHPNFVGHLYHLQVIWKGKELQSPWFLTTNPSVLGAHPPIRDNWQSIGYDQRDFKPSGCCFSNIDRLKKNSIAIIFGGPKNEQCIVRAQKAKNDISWMYLSKVHVSCIPKLL